MKTTVKNIMPHARRMKKQFVSNEHTVCEALQLTAEQYHHYLFESGMAFLEMFYDPFDPPQKRWINRWASDDKYGFWNWFAGEWRIREHLFLKAHRRGFTYNDWVSFHYRHTVSEELQQQFYHFIKQKNRKL